MKLNDRRAEIDEIDGELVALLRRRAELAQEIGRIKRRQGMPAYVPEREAQILRRVAELDRGPLSAQGLAAIFSEIISACRALERNPRVAYLGPELTWTHLAARKRFGSEADFVPTLSVEDTFAAVEKGRADFGVVPIENSIEGVVTRTMDCFVSSDLKICGELLYRIHHCLLARCALDEVQVVYSHPQPVAQCRQWLREHLAQVPIEQTESTSAAAARAAAAPRAAALASRPAGDHHGLQVIAENIEDEASNRTRFLVLGHQDCPPGSHDKTSLLFVLDHRPGALHRALAPFDDHGINLTMIQSRPAPGRTWEYVFFVDFQGHHHDPAARRALDALAERCHIVKLLGSYPVAAESA